MGFNKVSMYVMSILLIFYLLLPTNVIADGPLSKTSQPWLLLLLGDDEYKWKGDNFDSYPTGALVTPPDGWQSLNNRMWSIAAGELREMPCGSLQMPGIGLSISVTPLIIQFRLSEVVPKNWTM